jgi:hypothetical protein
LPGAQEDHCKRLLQLAADLLPHLAYGMATATVYEALADRAG